MTSWSLSISVWSPTSIFVISPNLLAVCVLKYKLEKKLPTNLLSLNACKLLLGLRFRIGIRPFQAQEMQIVFGTDSDCEGPASSRMIAFVNGQGVVWIIAPWRSTGSVRRR